MHPQMASLGKASFKLRAFVGVFSAVQICVCCVPPIQCQQARPGQTALGTSGLRDPHGKARKGEHHTSLSKIRSDLGAEMGFKGQHCQHGGQDRTKSAF